MQTPFAGFDAMTRRAIDGPDFARDVALCRELLRHGSKTFFAASHLLPRRVRAAATALYAFCRQADDAVDLGTAEADAVRRLRLRLERIYQGVPVSSPVDRALTAVVSDYAIPKVLPDALIEGVSWDDEGRQYDTFDDLTAYAARVAGAVGAMMALLMGVRDPRSVARACDLGVAMQLSNIARDVGEDVRNGRLYLPRSWLEEAGIIPEVFLAEPEWTPALAGVVTRLLAESERLYRQAESGIAQLPIDCRPGIFAARLCYAAIGQKAGRPGHNPLTDRAVVSTGGKLTRLAWAVAKAPVPRPVLPLPALPACQFLIDAVESTPLPVRATDPGVGTFGWWRFGSRTVRVLELLARLREEEMREREALRHSR